MPSFNIKKMLAGDAHMRELVSMFDAYRRFYGMSGDIKLASKFIRERLERDESTIFLAYENNHDNGQGLGFVQLYPFFSSVAATRIWVLNDLFVVPSGRSAGIGSALMDVAERFARETGASAITLETAPDNKGAQRLYESRGYRRTAEGDVYHYCLDLE